ncbi:MAG: orotidine-5'-phosphate decarboxylase [Defluviitaleaceae bacterium]|nr:orotidine-5'-phosphate decarboxylase [Defluviitaleaceae bacterium]
MNTNDFSNSNKTSSDTELNLVPPVTPPSETLAPPIMLPVGTLTPPIMPSAGTLAPPIMPPSGTLAPPIMPPSGTLAPPIMPPAGTLAPPIMPPAGTLASPVTPPSETLAPPIMLPAGLVDELVERIKDTTPICIGLDPRMNSGKDIYDFNVTIIDKIYDIVPAVKPQIAFYESLGAEGIEAYIKTVDYAKKKGLIVIGDIKRGDISTTAEYYSKAHLGNGAFKHDFITVSPYMGSDTITPYFENIKKFNKGLFVLLKTSNTGAEELQDLVYPYMVNMLKTLGQQFIGKSGYSAIGAVVGANVKRDVRSDLPNTFFLVPGVGAQGGTVKDMKHLFDKNKNGLLINSSRNIIYAENPREAVLALKKEVLK